MKPRVVVAMSGGVDSSVAAALLKERGYEVIGITMCFPAYSSSSGGAGPRQPRRPPCCGLQGIEDAHRVAHKLGIRHYVLNMQKDLERWVIEDFCREYICGRTPNPCVRCNQYLKFGILLKKVLSLDAGYLATGHYASIKKLGGPRLKTRSHFMLKKAKDKKRDQSYFLYRLNQFQLSHLLFPLGNYTKDEVRALARKFDLAVADKLGSQEICFLPDDDYRAFLEERLRQKLKPGPIVDQEGKVLGEHRGIAFYTIGQREGLGIALGYPVYITGIDRKKNQITVGRSEDSRKKEFLIKEPHFIFGPLKKKIALKARIRYNHTEAPADIVPLGKKIKICFRRPQFAITPGQSAVIYDKDAVVGGGVIDKVIA
jgi:tRNA-specific 2-thiouridylase